MYYIYWSMCIVIDACLIEATVVFKWNQIFVIASYITNVNVRCETLLIFIVQKRNNYFLSSYGQKH